MAADQNADAATVGFFPPLAPFVTVLAGIGLERLWPLDFGFFTPTAIVRFGVGGVIVIGALLGLGLWSVLTMRRTGETVNPYKPTTAIVERGPFRFTRNPMYLQMVLICIGFAMMFANVWILLLTPVCAWSLYRGAIVPEEAYLERKFGDAYRDYKRRVRRWV
jgi:protein-S-isoprenylcysteine O-methyltransferase Ste14